MVRGKLRRHTSLACSRVSLGRVRGAGAGSGATAGPGAGAGPVASGSVKIVTWELSTAELSNTDGVSGEADRGRVMPTVRAVDVEDGGD